MMKPAFKSLVIASLLASAGFSAMAQKPTTDAAADGKPRMEHHQRMDPAKMEEMHAKRVAELKTKLKITPAQEGAWTTFTAAMKPPARDAKQRPDRAELDKLSTPERLDKVRALRTQHMADMQAQMDKRDEATKAFYAVLSPEQKKLFDEEHARMGSHRGGGRK
jgi:protein CpxP